MATTVKHEISDWQSEAFRREALKEARKDARNARKRVIIKVGSTKMGYRTVATVDGRFYVGKITTLGILFLTACSGGSFGKAEVVVSDSGTDTSSLVSQDANVLPDSSRTLVSDAHGDAGSGTKDSASPKDSGQSSDAGERPHPLTCPESVDSCDGKAWNGKVCEGIYSVCCNGQLCACCLG